ncbi:MAG: hypothetical protein KGQ41_06530 [Alphaproteobacteria bacterium]|nr:hypothetical protein [Alphaproteobacteria bacterium]
MRIIVFLFALLLPAAAFAKCYNAQQLEAEQGLRIHSELMVIALNCQHLAQGSLYHQYEDFTRKHNALIQGYEDTMRAFYKGEGQNGEVELNNLRTRLANRIANEAVRLQPNVFCRAYGSRITQANAMSQEKLRTWAQTVFPTYPLTRSICEGVSYKTQQDK